MRLFSVSLILTFVLLACNADQAPSFNRNPKEIVSESGIDVEVYDFENFKPFLNQKDDQIHVLNFWATWCVPCVAELPYFEELGAAHPEIEIILVSLDFPKKIKENLIPFIQKNTLMSEVVLLDEPDGNKWIPQVDPNWSGAIPATIIYKNDKSKFYEQSFNFVELEEAVASFEN
jgi:thiol-disulfide isomerase/thioredoxin